MTTVGHIINRIMDGKNVDYVSNLIEGLSVRNPSILLFDDTVEQNRAIIIGEFEDKELSISIIVAPESSNLFSQIHNGWVLTKKSDTESATGTAGIRPLVKLFRQVEGIVCWAKKIGVKKVTCTPTDEKRKKAYSVLTRIGFEWDDEFEEYAKKL